MPASVIDVSLFALATFLGNFGVAITGFGMAIIFLFVWQVASLAGWGASLQKALGMQALGLLVAQPQLIKQAQMWKHADRRLMALVLPLIVASTPFGQLVGERVDRKLTQAVTGFIVLGLCLFELCRLRAVLRAFCGRGAAPNTDDKAGQVCEDITVHDPCVGFQHFDPEGQVFFMIGMQRSGSNWLRTLLGERDDLDAPHPPHIMDNYIPRLSKFGDLSDPDRLADLVDHVSNFTEKNQVPWTDLHGRPFELDRDAVAAFVQRELRRVGSDEEDFNKGEDFNKLVLLAIFDAIYSMRAEANSKRTWMCKSMGMSKYHNLLLTYYGKERLRYIYLVRDPRDVAMSFLKTPVGDCHLYVIAQKWVQLQELASHILEETPDLVHTLHYEDLLKSKDVATEKVHEFLGPYRFSDVDSSKSVMAEKTATQMNSGATTGREAMTAKDLSYQFMNLGKGQEFADQQFQKWLNGPEPLAKGDLLLIESVAHVMMARFGYEPYLVGNGERPLEFSSAQIEEFHLLNAAAIEKMNADLLVNDPADAGRRKRQAEALDRPVMVPKSLPMEVGVVPSSSSTVAPSSLASPVRGLPWSDGSSSPASPARSRLSADGSTSSALFKKEKTAYSKKSWLAESNAHSPDQIRNLVQASASTATVELSDGFRLHTATATLKGYYPRKCMPNQDAVCAYFNIGGEKQHFIGVFDGSGPTGERASKRAAAEMPARFIAALEVDSLPVPTEMKLACDGVSNAIVNDAEVDPLSGTTAICAHFNGRQIHVSCVGDSQCFLGSVDPGGQLSVKTLSHDHTPFREEERARILGCGARVLTQQQLEEDWPIDRQWKESDGGVPRVWAGDSRQPGVAFTRSLGHAAAKDLGVISEPDVIEHHISPSDRVLIVCSDGITDRLPTQLVCECALKCGEPVEACASLITMAVERWAAETDRCDDISISVNLIEPPVACTSQTCLSAAKPFLAAGAMGCASGFLGGLCGIPGPPVILYFLHYTCSKEVQKANGTCITGLTCLVRVIYLTANFFAGREDVFSTEDVHLYVSISVAAILGTQLGGMLFRRVKDAQAIIKCVLAMLLLLNGATMVLASLA